MTNFVDTVEALKKKAEAVPDFDWRSSRGQVLSPRGIVADCPTPQNGGTFIRNEIAEFIAAASPDFILELCDKALEAERLLREMTADRDLWQQAHDEDCPNKALVETLEAEIARLKGDQ